MVDYPRLPHSYKRRYPFRLACPSYIYPDDVYPNVALLAPCVDEIELILFESRPDSLPDAAAVHRLARLAEAEDTRFNVHLPIDIPVCGGGAERWAAVIGDVIDLTRPLHPTTHTLHLDYSPPDPVDRWQKTVRRQLSTLLDRGVDPALISIETLDYPFAWVEDIISDFGLRVCLDIGHLILYEFNVAEILARNAVRTVIIHLHGVEDGRDHLALDRMPAERLDAILRMLSAFDGTLSLEVFSYAKLADSLACLEAAWPQQRPL